MNNPDKQNNAKKARPSSHRVKEKAADYYIAVPNSVRKSAGGGPSAIKERDRNQSTTDTMPPGNAPENRQGNNCAKPGRWDRFSGIISPKTARKMKKLIEEEFE
jgi:hypothetical protein